MPSGYWEGAPHPTDGLAGYPARDFGAPGGTVLYAWDRLIVDRISGSSGPRGKGFGGFNLYLKDRAGKQYFVTHVENVRVKVGDRLTPGTQIARVGSYKGMATHVHIGYTGGDPTNTLGLKPEYLFYPGGAVAGSRVVESHLPKSSGGGGIGSFLGGITSISGIDVIEGITGKNLPDVDQPTPGDVAHGAKETVKAITSIPDAIRWVGGNWDRIAEVLGGVVLILIGLILMGRSLGVTKTKIELVDKNLPGGMDRFAQREAARAEQQSYTRAARTAGRRRALGTPEPRRRSVRPLDAEPRERPASVGPSEEIPY